MLALLLIAWTGLLAILMWSIGRKGEGGALTIAYFLGISLIHVPGILPFLTSVSFSAFSQGLSNRETTLIGFEVTIAGMLAFVAGSILARAIDHPRARAKFRVSSTRSRALERAGRRALAIGAVGYFILLPSTHSVASLTAAVSPLAILLIIGIWLMLYGAAETEDRQRTWTTLVLMPMLPLATLVTGGFIGYGVYWVLGVVAFLYVVSRHRIWFFATAPILIYFGLSLFVAYMGQRSAIRELVWEKQAGLAERLDRVAEIFTHFHPLDLTSPIDLGALDSRLNQNALVGLAIAHINTGWAQFAYGGTVPVWALVPRVIWPDKPDVGGGRSVVEDFTGIHVWEGTSVGTGQVMEFYVNFGMAGVLGGFLLLGFALMWLDRGIMRALARADMRGLLLRGLPGLTLLQPGGNLLEIFVALFAAIGLSLLLIHVRALRIMWADSADGQVLPFGSNDSSMRLPSEAARFGGVEIRHDHR